MDIGEILSALEVDAAQAESLEKALQEARTEGPQVLEAMLAGLLERDMPRGVADAVIGVLDRLFRKWRDSEVGGTLGYYTGLFVWRKLGDLARAEFFMRAVDQNSPYFEIWREFYRQFYASRGNWLRLEQFMAETAKRAGHTNVETQRILAKTAREFGNQSKELSYWQAVAAEAPEDPEADIELERLYTETGRWSSLANLLKARFDRLPPDDVKGRVALLKRMLVVFRDHMKAEPKVLSTYQQILDIDPTDKEAIDALLERYEAAGRWPEYAKTLQRKIEQTEDRAERVRLLELRAKLMETKFVNALEAIKAYEELLVLEPQRADIIEKLKELYGKRQDFENVIRIRRLEAERQTDPKAKVAIISELALLATERIRKVPLAIALWEEVLALQPDHADALRNLESLYEREKNIPKLCDVLERRVELAREDSERVVLLEKLAQVLGTRAADPERAAEAWRRILDIRPDHDRAKRELRARYLAAHRWDDLEWFLRKFATVEELARTLEAQVGSLTEPQEKMAILFKLAALWRDELGQPARAVKNLEAVLALDPQNLEAANALIALYHKLSDYKRLPPVYDIAIAQTADRERRLSLMIEAAEVLERHLRDLEKAFFWYLEAFKEDMLNEALRAELERLAGPTNNWDIYVAVLEQAATIMPQSEAKVRVWLRVGEIYADEVRDEEQALRAYQQVLDLDPVNRQAIAALEALYRKTANYEALVKVLYRRLELERRADEQRAIRFEIAQVLFSQLRRADQAIEMYEAVLLEDPTDGRAYDELADILLQERRFEDLLNLLRRQVEVFSGLPAISPEIIADLYCRIGVLTCGIYGPSMAAVVAWSKALEYSALHLETLAWLEEMVAVPELRLSVVQLLKGPYEALGRFSDLADLMEIEAMERGDEASVQLLWALHDLYTQRLSDMRKGFRTLCRILAVNPSDRRAWDAAEGVAGQIQAWRELAQRFEVAASAIADLSLQVELKLRLARIYERVDNIEQAKRCYHEVLAADERNIEALEALEAIYEESADHQALFDIYRRRYEVSEYVGEKIAYAFKMASELAEYLGDIEGAIKAIGLVLEIEPDSDAAYRMLAHYQATAEKWGDYARTLQERIRLADSKEARAEIRMDLAKILEEKLSDIEGAVLVYRAILAEDPEHDGALRELERLFPDQRVRTLVAPILLPVYERREDWARLVEVYEVLAEAEEDVENRIRYYDTIANLYETRLGDLDRAFETRARAFAAAPGRADLVDALLEAGRARGAVIDAVLVLCEHVFNIEDEQRRMETHRVIAAEARRAGERDLAKRHFNEILAMEPSDMDAVEALIEMYREDDEPEPLQAMLRRKAENVLAAEEKAELLLQAADILALRLKWEEDAIRLYRHVLDLVPTNMRAIEALEGLYRGLERYNDLVELLQRKADVALDKDVKVAALCAKGEVLHEKLGDRVAAIETYHQALDLSPERVDILRTLDFLYGKEEDWWNQYRMLERLLPFVEGSDRLALQVRMGRLLEQRLGDPAAAVRIYAEVLAADPSNAETLDALEGMVRAGEAAVEAFEVLEPALARNEQWERLYVVREVLAEREEEIPTRVAHLMEMGRIASEKLAQPLRAFECYRQAFLADPIGREALEMAEALAAEYDLWAEVPAIIEQGVAEIEGTPEALELRLHAARLLWDRLGDREAAVRAYEAVLKDYPDNRDALAALDVLYAEMERYEDLARVLRARADAEQDPQARIPYLLRHADVAEKRLGQPKQALESRREVLYLSPGQPEAVAALRATFDAGNLQTEILEILEPIYREAGEWEALTTLLEAALPVIQEADDKKATMLRLSDVYKDKLGRLDLALQWRGKALIIDPADEALANEVESLATEIGAWADLYEIWLEAAAKASDERQVSYWHKAAGCARDRLGDLDKAEKVYRWVLDVAGTDRQALAALDAIYASRERWEALHDILEQEWKAAEFDDEKVGYLLRLGALNRDRLENPDGALRAYREALKIDETNREALEALVELLEGRGEWQDLFKTLEALSMLAASGEERASILRRMAIIAENKLADIETAQGLWDEISRILPEDLEALRELERIYAIREDWAAFIDTCEREIALVRQDEGRVVELLRRVAQVSEQKQGDAYLAQHAWRRLLEVSASDLEALEALRRLYRETGDLEGLSDVLYRLAEAYRGEQLESLLVEHARLLTDELPRPDGAIERWNRVLELNATNVEALAALERLYEDTGSYGQCVEVVKRRAELETDRVAKASVLLRAADLEADRVGDLRAASATLEEVLQLFPLEPGMEPGPEELRLLREVFDRQAEILRRLEDFEKLAELLLRRDALPAPAEERVANFMELARCYEERLDNKSAAFYAVVKAAQVEPTDEAVLSEAWRLAQALGNFEEYVEAIDVVTDRMPGEIRLEHLKRFGECFWKRLGRPEDALVFYERAAKEWGEDSDVLAALTDLYEIVGRHEDLVRTLEARARLSEDYLEQSLLLMRAARVLEENLRDSERAVACYREVLRVEESNTEALRALARLHEQRKEWEELVKVLENLASLVPSEEVSLRLKIAEVLEGKIGDIERATRAYENVLSLEPANARALERLQALYGEQNNWKGLAQVFERLLDYSSEIPDRVLFCERLGILYEQALGDKVTALEYYQRILDMTPGDEEVFETCVRLSGEIGDWSGAIGLLESWAGQVSDVREKAATLARIARIYDEKLGDTNAAIATWQRVLDVDPGYIEAYSELVRLLGEVESWEEVVETLLRWKEHAEEHEFAVLMLRAATVVKERLENPERALKLLGDVLRVDPRNAEAAEKMRLIYAEFEEWEKVAEVYLMQEAHEPSDEGKARLRAAAGEIYLNKLKDQSRAVQHFEKALELNPKMLEVALSLARAYVASKKWEKALPLLDMLLGESEVMADQQKAAEIHYQLGLCAENVYDYDKAYREYQMAHKIRPEHAGTLAGLGRIYQRKQLWQLAKDHFTKALEVLGEEAPQEDVVNLHFACAEASLELGDTQSAVEHLDKVRRVRPSDERALAMLISVAERGGDWSAVVRYKQALAEVKEDQFERFALWLEIGDIYREKIGNIYGATAAYKEALEINPDARVALLRLFDLYYESGQIEDAIYILDRLAAAEDNPEKRALHYMRAAALYREKLRNDTKAVEYLNLALDADPERLEAFRAIDEILTASKRWEEQADAYRRMIERVKDSGLTDLEFRLYSGLGEIYRSRLRRLDYAIPAYAMAARLKPDDLKTHAILAQLYELQGDQWDRAIEENRAIVELQPLSPEAAIALKALRRIFRDRQDFDKAFMTASALVALRQADREESEFFEHNLEPSLPWFKGTIEPLRWEAHLMSKKENPILGMILQVLYQGLGADLGARELRDLGLKKKNEVDLDQKLVFANVYKAVSKALGALPHKVYRDEGTVGMKVEFLTPPALIVGPDMFTGRDEREIAFLVGRQITYLHPRHFLAAVKGLADLKVFMAAAWKFARPEVPIVTGAEVVAELVRLIERKMPQALKNQLSRLIMDLEAREPDMDFGRLLQEFFVGMELTAIRAGVLVCGNLDIAANIIGTEEVSFSGLPKKERVGEVIRFGVSEDHFVLRRALGVSIEAAPL